MKLEMLVERARAKGASDIHIVAGVPVIYRVSGDLVVEGDVVTVQAAAAFARTVLDEAQQAALRTRQLCFSLGLEGGERVRLTVYLRNGCPEMAIRLSERRIRLRDDLRLPPVVDELALRPNGLVIITGPTGVGKTTTFHYMIDLINAERSRKIVTLEDPVEYVHRPKRAIVVQHEVLSDTPSFRRGLLDVLRQDPDVIGIGEMRDRETMFATLTAAETGHLVIATLHTPNASQAVERIVSVFPDNQQGEVRIMLANTLQGIIAQHLLPRADGKGRILCREVLTGTPGVRNLIRSNMLHKLVNEMQTGARFGMMTMDRDLLELYQQGEITYDTAIGMARFPESIRTRTA